MKLRKREKIWLLIAALCAAAAIAVTAACRLPAGAATVVLAPLETGSAPAAQSAPAARVNLNTATAAELDALPGIGATLAQRIVDYRAANGNFRRVEDVMKVPGIGAGKYEKIQNSITVTQEDGT